MRAAQASYLLLRVWLLPLIIFLLSGVFAITQQQLWWILVPFAYVLFVPMLKYVTTYTENIFWLLLITLPLSAAVNITPSLGLDLPDEPLMILLTALVLMKLVQQPASLPSALRDSQLFFILIIYGIWLVITCAYSIESWLSVKFLLAKIWYIVPFVIAPQFILTSKKNIAKLAVCLLVPMLLGVLQSLIRHAAYDFSFENIRKIWSPFFRNHVNYSAILVCLLPVAYCMWILTPKERFVRKWIMTGMLIGAAGLVFAYSRGAWIAMAAGIAAVWVIRKRMMSGVIAIITTIVLLSTIWLVTDKHFMRFIPDHDRTYFHTDFNEHMLATMNGKDVSGAERIYRWVAGANMIAEKPMTGFGPNTFYPHYRSYTIKSFRTWVSNNPEHSTVHNYFILVAIEQGLIGLILFCTLYTGMLLSVQKLYHRFADRFYQMVTLTIGVILVMTLVINCLSDMIETDKTGGIFWLCLGMIILLHERSKETVAI